MTYNNIYEKFLIEYDKANITSSYPSLTDFEIATILDKAYLALIAQKLTGNNQRKAGFEYDTKAIQDIQGLIISQKLNSVKVTDVADNEAVFNLPDTFMYYVDSTFISGTDKYGTQLIDHALADKFKVTAYNKPWVKIPVVYLENNTIHTLYDSSITTKSFNMILQYVKTPYKFVVNHEVNLSAIFELSDSMAEELINLAIIFATETTMSPRLQTKTSLLSLES